MSGAGVTAARRAHVLHALGVTPWRRRDQPAEPALPAPDTPPSDQARCIVVMPAGSSTRALDLLGRALHHGGATLARAGRVSVSGGQLVGALPPAPVYLVLGQAQAHALGRELSAATMKQTHIALVDEPAALLTDAAGKRRLWTAMRQLRRVLADLEGR